MKIRLEKPAVNIANLTTGGKNEKARRGGRGGGADSHERLRLDLYFG